jgi:hypothetical protein
VVRPPPYGCGNVGLAVLVVVIKLAPPAAGSPGALHEAAISGNVTALKDLVSKIAPSDLQSVLTQCYQKPSGSSACFDSSGKSQDYMCTALENNIGDCISVLDAAAIRRQAAVVQYLLTDLKAQPNLTNAAKKTALHYAFIAFPVWYHPCEDALRKTVLALLAGGALLVTSCTGKCRGPSTISTVSGQYHTYTIPLTVFFLLYGLVSRQSKLFC